MHSQGRRKMPPKKASLNDLIKAEPSTQSLGPSQRAPTRRATAGAEGRAAGSQAAEPATQGGGRGKRQRRASQAEDIPESSRAAEQRAAAEAAAAAAAEAAEAAEEGGSAGDEDLLHHKILELEAEAAASQDQESPVSTGEEKQLVRAVVRFMLFRQAAKPGVPVKRDELTKLVLASYQRNNQKTAARLTGHIIRKAQATFPSAFGMELAEVSLKTPGRPGDGGAKGFLLRSLLPVRLRARVETGRAELSQALAMVVLLLIALSGGKLNEDELMSHLQKLGVTAGQAHPTLGKPAEQLQELVNRRYLARIKVDGADGSQQQYAIGPAAVEEVGEARLKGFIEEVFKGTRRQR